MMLSYVDLHFTVKVIKNPMQRKHQTAPKFQFKWIRKINKHFSSPPFDLSTFRLKARSNDQNKSQKSNTISNQKVHQPDSLSLSPPLSWLLFFSIAFIYVFLVWANPLKMKIWLSGCGYLTFCTNRFTIPLNHRQSSNRNAERAKNTHCTHTAKTHKPFR